MDYKYLTQDIIESGGRNITSPEVFAEARVYNIEAVKNYKKRRDTRLIFDIWIIVQYFLVVFITYSFVQRLQGDQVNSGTSTPGWRIVLGFIGFFAYLGLITYYMVIKSCRDKLMLGIMSLPIIAVTWGYAFFPAANFVAGWLYTKVDSKLSKELGYPAFPRLNLIVLNSDVEKVSDLTFDSIREKANRDHPHDGGFL